MKVREGADLRALNTFAAPARASLLLELETEEDLLSTPVFDPARSSTPPGTWSSVAAATSCW